MCIENMKGVKHTFKNIHELQWKGNPYTLNDDVGDELPHEVGLLVQTKITPKKETNYRIGKGAK